MINRVLYLFLIGLFFQSNTTLSCDPDFLFETQDLQAKLLKPENLEEVKNVKNLADQTYLTSGSNEGLEDFLEKQQNFSNKNLKEDFEKNGAVGIGLFLKSNSRLIGIGFLIVRKNVWITEEEGSVEKPVSPSLETSLRFIKTECGQGYGTQYKKGLIQYLASNALIPTHEAGFSEQTSYWGSSGLVDFKNKASLSANLKCNYGIFDLLGPDVHLYYPRNAAAEKGRDGNEDLMSAW